MRVPLSWLKEYVDFDLTPEELAKRLTFAGLEVEAVEYIGLAPHNGHIDGLPPADAPGPKAKGLAWDRSKIVVGRVFEVMPHPNADRLVLCRLDDGQTIHTVLTGAPNLFPYKGQGPLARPLKVAYAREGSVLYDGHQPGQVLATLSRMKIRGVESYSMICSEKELGISEAHEGVMILSDDAPVGAPLADYLGDVIFTVKINPNMARNACLVGIAREVAALTGRKLRPPSYGMKAEGESLRKQLKIRIEHPDLNPRFTAVLIRGVSIGPSPEWMQRRLTRAGMRPINNIVDITNYVMLETGQPLHAFDWDSLAARAGGPVTIVTRTAKQGETLTTLDGAERRLDEFTVLVCDEKGALSIAGVMGGAESEVRDETKNILLEAAAWDYINIRRTVDAQKLPSEAAFRFSRGVHPAVALRGLSRAAELMRTLGGGAISRDVVDAYPKKAPIVRVDLPLKEVRRLLGIHIPLKKVAQILESLEFSCRVKETAPRRKRKGKIADEDVTLQVAAPDHRLDIGKGVIGQADLIEEIARIYGYDRIPEAQIGDLLPKQRSNTSLEQEEAARDLLVDLGLQEVLTYHLTAPEREAGMYPPGGKPPDPAYIRLANPIVPERCVMRRSVLAAVLETAARNAAHTDRIALFELGPVYLPGANPLPDEPAQLAIVMAGPRTDGDWRPADRTPMDFYDLKGILEEWFAGLHLDGIAFESASDPRFHPGRCAKILLGGHPVGVAGQMHPQTAARYEWAGRDLLAAELEFELLRPGLQQRYAIAPISDYPPVLEDLAVAVPEAMPARRVIQTIRSAGGGLLKRIRLFDVYRGEQAGAGMKSLAFSLAYQSSDKTLSNAEAAELRGRIIEALEGDLGGKVRR
ncbi:MAG: phenylalanine--tRNA ligase subunit beta [Anaerolineales bacterium]|nr:phenylalanine--tRNA ligase subunit beta [Anaerolineales bacterium]